MTMPFWIGRMALPATAVWFISATFVPAAMAFGGGGGDGGCCGVPPELVKQAAQLEKSFASADEDALRRQRWAGDLCASHPCGDITEEQAKLLLDDLAAQKQRKADRSLSSLSVLIGLVGVLIAAYALRQTAQANRFAREAEARSIKSEVRLDHLEKHNA